MEPLTQAERLEIDTGVRRAAYHIIAGKGATYYGIGSAVARLVDVLLHDQRAILTVCYRAAEVSGVPGVTLSLPRLVGGTGVLETLPVTLDENEQAALQRSAVTLAEATASIATPTRLVKSAQYPSRAVGLIGSPLPRLRRARRSQDWPGGPFRSPAGSASIRLGCSKRFLTGD